jgi:aminoglycoside N3'-acetyltransferase
METVACLSQKEIENGLREAGLKSGMMVEVHSSLSSFGHVQGGADAVIKALQDVVGENGTIVMPAFRISPPQTLDPDDKRRGLVMKLKVLAPDHRERSGMGLIADTFQRLPGVITGEGMFRVCAWGKDKEIHSRGLSHLIDNGGYGLLMGVDIYRLSSMHYMEGDLPQQVRDLFAPSQAVKAYYPEDEWFVETGVPPVRDWYKIQDEAYRLKFIRDTMIGKSKCMFFKVRDVVGLYKKALRTDPLGLYRLR